MARVGLVVVSLLVVVPASGCFDPDAPPIDPTLGPASTSGDSATGITTFGSTDTMGEPTASATSTTSGDPTTATTTGADGGSSDSGSSSGEMPAACGDGAIAGTEICDDGNVLAGDGCSDACVVEEGFGCEGEPSMCATICGDGVVTDDEACDDGDVVAGNGCTACSVDPGYSCRGEPSVCTTACGDGVVGAGESCDDGDVMSGNGCAADCTVELHYRCVGQGPGSCAPIRILYAPADGDDAAFRGAIAAITGGPVDYQDAGSSTPSLVELQAGWDCVLTHPNFTYADSLTFGNTLASYVDGGGSVVLGIATDFAPSTGLSTSMIMQAAYAPVTTSGGVTYGPTANYVGDGTTLIHDGVVAYDAPIFDSGVMLQGGGVADAIFDNGTIAVAYRPDFKVVYVNGTGNVSFGPTGDWPRLVANACAVGFVQ